MTKEQINANVVKRISELSFEDIQALYEVFQQQLEAAVTAVNEFTAWVQQYVLYQLEFLWHVTKEAST